jgi:integrase/recombinase XerD
MAAAEVDDAGGLRDRAMVEVVYAGGVRVSEWSGVSREQGLLRQGVLRVGGSGG